MYMFLYMPIKNFAYQSFFTDYGSNLFTEIFACVLDFFISSVSASLVSAIIYSVFVVISKRSLTNKMSTTFWKEIFFLMCILRCCSATVKEISCEKIECKTWTLGIQNTCYMNEVTSIDSTGFTISSLTETTIGALNFYNNKKILFLPENPTETFTNLVIFGANSCSVKTIAKANFRGLNQLRALYLNNNQIKIIHNNTFEDLLLLEHLELCK